MSYAEPESDTGPEDDDDVFKPKPRRRIVPAHKRRKISASPEEDTYEQNDGSSAGDDGVLFCTHWAYALHPWPHRFAVW